MIFHSFLLTILFFVIALYLETKKDTAKKKTIFFDEKMNFSRITITAIEDFQAQSEYSIADLEECFFFFLQEFGPIASGYNSYNERKRQLTCFQDSCTPSDEALIIFFLEMNWENWIDQVDNEAQGKKRKIGSTKKFSGWTSDDVKKFNDVCHLVSSAREDRKDLEEKYKLLVKNKNCYTKINSRSEGVLTADEHEVIPYTDLLSDFNDSQSSLVTPNMSQEYEESYAKDVDETEVNLTEHFSQEDSVGDLVAHRTAV